MPLAQRLREKLKGVTHDWEDIPTEAVITYIKRLTHIATAQGYGNLTILLPSGYNPSPTYNPMELVRKLEYEGFKIHLLASGPNGSRYNIEWAPNTDTWTGQMGVYLPGCLSLPEYL